MPELPEVEQVRRNLKRWLVGARIVAAHGADRNVVRGTARAFSRLLVGRTIKDIVRRGKWLRIELDDATKVFAHLGMTGDWQRDGADRFERARLEVERKKKHYVVRYIDPRRWGRIIVTRDDISSWLALGPDPLHDGIDTERLEAKLTRSKRSVKEVLMDQTVLAGVGNIHAIEALWKARIDPRSPARALDHAAVNAIASGIHWTIRRALADLAKGDKGADNPFKIYGRKGEPCPRCKTPIERFELGGRTTSVCPHCQRTLGGRRANGKSERGRKGVRSRNRKTDEE